METCLYNGKQICAYDVVNRNYALNYELRKQLRIAGRNGELTCEECGKEVHLRINDPKKKIPHFSHKTTDDKCPYGSNDLRESDEHKKGKMILYKYFKEKYPDISPKLNHRFPNRRKSDLYIEFSNGDKLAVEYQRTELDILEWQERQAEYMKSDINVLWLLSGKEENITNKEKQIEVTFFQQIMLNELEKVAVYLDINNIKIILAKNMRYSDPYLSNNDFEKLYIKAYSIYDVQIHTNGNIECDFVEEYKKSKDKFTEYYKRKCYNDEIERQKKKELENKRKIHSQRIKEEVRNFPISRPINFEVEPEEEQVRYFKGTISYKYKLKAAFNGDNGAVKEVVRQVMEWGCSDDPKIITLICKYHYLKGNKKAKEVYEKIMLDVGFESANLEKEQEKKQLVCPICKGKLIEKYGKYGPFVSCSNYPKCNFLFNV